MPNATKKPLMVGDSAPDIEAANALNIPSACVSFGYSAAPIDRLNASVIINQYTDLFTYFDFKQ